MPPIPPVFDLLLAAAVVGLAWRALASADLFAAIVLYVSLGLTMALVWVRLGAPDVALAEAAIGAGLSGALFLSTLAHLQRGGAENGAEHGGGAGGADGGSGERDSTVERPASEDRP